MASLARSGNGSGRELRDDARRAVFRAPEGQVVIKDRAHSQTVHAIRDLSSRGVSLCVDDELQPGEPVVVEVQRDGRQLAYYGYVAWCQQSAAMGDDLTATSRHVVGLRMVGTPSLGQLAPR